VEDGKMGKGRLIKIGKKVLVEGGKALVPDVMELGTKIGSELIEKQKNLIKIPNLKDVHIDEALRILKELNLLPTSAVANPSLAYADESENEVMYSEPKFGSRVNPKTTVKVYYLTQEVIVKSKDLLGHQVQKIEIPRVIGLNIYEAREDLEGLGLKVTEKLEKPNLKFFRKEDGQVTRVTYPNDQKIGSKFKTGDRVWLYYVSEEIITESKFLKDKKDQDKREIIDKIGKVPKNIAKKINKPIKMKKLNLDKNKE